MASSAAFYVKDIGVQLLLFLKSKSLIIIKDFPLYTLSPRTLQVSFQLLLAKPLPTDALMTPVYSHVPLLHASKVIVLQQVKVLLTLT